MLSRKVPFSSPLPTGERSAHEVRRVRGDCLSRVLIPLTPNPLPIRSRIYSTSASQKVPNSGKPEFGGEREPAAYALTSANPVLGEDITIAIWLLHNPRTNGLYFFMDRFAFDSLSMASIMATGLAMPWPAISWALPCATEENKIGTPMVNAAVAFSARSFAAMCP